MEGVEHYLHAYKHQEDTVGETGEILYLAVAIREADRRRPFAHDCCSQADCESSTVKQHVDTISEKTKRAGSETVEELDKHEGQV